MGMLVLSGVDQRPGRRVSQIGGGVVVAGGHGMTRDDHQMAVESVRAGQPGLKLGEYAVGQGVESLNRVDIRGGIRQRQRPDHQLGGIAQSGQFGVDRPVLQAGRQPIGLIGDDCPGRSGRGRGGVGRQGRPTQLEQAVLKSPRG